MSPKKRESGHGDTRCQFVLDLGGRFRDSRLLLPIDLLVWGGSVRLVRTGFADRPWQLADRSVARGLSWPSTTSAPAGLVDNASVP